MSAVYCTVYIKCDVFKKTRLMKRALESRCFRIAQNGLIKSQLEQFISILTYSTKGYL